MLLGPVPEAELEPSSGQLIHRGAVLGEADRMVEGHLVHHRPEPKGAGLSGKSSEVLNILDDHSRLCVASRVFLVAHAPDVVRTVHHAAATWGYPQRLLTDNGRIFTSPMGQRVGALELELMSLGIATRHSRPNHPQTCGKVERFHQTLKKHLAKNRRALGLFGGKRTPAPRQCRTVRPHALFLLGLSAQHRYEGTRG